MQPAALHHGAEFARACETELEAAYNTCRAEAAGVAYEVNEEQTARRSLSAYALRSLGGALHVDSP
jgi:hypothetical protein